MNNHFSVQSSPSLTLVSGVLEPKCSESECVCWGEGGGGGGWLSNIKSLILS